MTTAPLRVYLVDDEPLAIERLERLLTGAEDVQVIGAATDPATAVEALSRDPVDAVFLDIQMPGMNGFELLSRLREQPLVIFTTAYDQYALKAFEVNSIDFLLKPIDPEQLQRALRKLKRLRGGPKPEWNAILEQLSSALRPQNPEYKDRISSRIGDHVYMFELAEVTHFFARDKLTYAVSNGRSYPVDHSIADLERKLDSRKFIRIHRSTLLNLDWVAEMNSRFGARVVVILKDAAQTRLEVARDRVSALREQMAL